MDFHEYALARKQQVEERIGTRLREQKAREDALARKTKERLAKQERHAGSG